ncbi:hypothetical protein [Pseudoduganella sp.]|uniref:hypothetical protein n=1 Tax=Pseudoduganella sp. TaxID=1880898 RepID=UPI0035B38CFE
MASDHHALARLGLEPGAGKDAIRRAYARELKLIDLEADPAAFQQLREAYEQALGMPAPPTAAAAAEPWVGAAEEEAQEAYDWMVAAVTVIANGRRVADETIWVDELREQLMEQQPASIDGGSHLERAIGRLLSQGWKPGHEALLIAATQHFGWEDKGNWPNLHIAEAWFERYILHRQSEVLRGPLLRVIRDLRQTHDPDPGRLRRDHGYLQHFARYYANLAPVIVDEQRLLRWQELAQPLGPAPDVSWAPPAGEDEESPVSTFFRIALAFIAFVMWIALYNQSPNQ